MKGKMIAVYGVNGIGKSTQVELLVKYLQAQGKKVHQLKYPVYELEPEGPFIYKYLRDPVFREANQISTEELQLKYAKNRERHEATLLSHLENGEYVVAEDYTGTGISWGLTWGATLEYLEDINKNLHKADLSILMHGERFHTAIEKGHRNELADERIRICKNFHLLLGERYGWKTVRANQSREEVASSIQNIVDEFLSK
jgi:thymidylate kinase